MRLTSSRRLHRAGGVPGPNLPVIRGEPQSQLICASRLSSDAIDDLHRRSKPLILFRFQ